MGCEELKAHLADHLAGTLPPDVAGDVAAHLRTCPACAAEAAALEDTWQTLGTLHAERADSAGMRARFSAMLAGYDSALGGSPAHIGPAEAGPSGVGRARVIRYASWMSAAAAMLILGVLIGRQMGVEPAQPADTQITALRDEMRVMREMFTLSLLQQQSASERLRGVSAADRIDDPGSQITSSLVDVLMHDPNDNVRLRTIDVLKRFAGEESVRRGTMAALPQQNSPIVQVALIDFLMEVYGRDAAPAVRRLSTDPMVDQAVRARAEQRLAQLGV